MESGSTIISNNELFAQVLFFSFVGVYIVMALIAAGAIIGWIKMDNKIKWALFTSLVLQTVASVIALFNIIFVSDISDDKLRDLLVKNGPYKFSNAWDNWEGLVEFYPDGKDLLASIHCYVQKGNFKSTVPKLSTKGKGIVTVKDGRILIKGLLVKTTGFQDVAGGKVEAVNSGECVLELELRHANSFSGNIKYIVGDQIDNGGFTMTSK